MREPFEKIGDQKEYIPRNARVTDIAVTPEGIYVYMTVADNKDVNMELPLRGDVIGDLCRIFDVPDLLEVKHGNVVVRALQHMEWNGINCIGIAHLIDGFGVCTYDYKKTKVASEAVTVGFPVSGHVTATAKSPGMFTMATINPPPGLPWTVQNQDHMGFKDLPFGIMNSEGGCIGNVGGELAQWMVKEAQIAQFVE